MRFPPVVRRAFGSLGALTLVALTGLVTACGQPEPEPGPSAPTVAPPPKPVVEQAPSAEVQRGEVLVASYGCTACHAADPERAARLRPAPAPNLAIVGGRRTLGGLAAQIAHPRPDARGDFACGARATAEEALALASWLTRDGAVPLEPVEVLPHEVEAGRVLFDQIGCRGCHSASDSKGGLDLAALEGHYSIDSLGGFLAAPLAAWPSGRHPDFGLTDDQARRLATFVLAGDRVTYTRQQGLRYEYFEAEDFPGDEPDWDSMQAVDSGQTGTIGIDKRQRDDQFGLRLTGLVQLPVTGEYTFELASDDGSYLDLGGKRFIDHGGLHGNFPRTETIHLEAGSTPIQISMFERTGDEMLQLRFEVPAPENGAAPIEQREFTADELAFDRAEYAPQAPLLSDTSAPTTLDGAALYTERGCLACHGAADGAAEPPAAAPLAKLRAGAGCLALTPPPSTPHFAFQDAARAASAAEHVALAAYFAAPTRPTGALAPAARITRELKRLGCTGCHERGGIGGPKASARDYFGQSYTGDDLGDEGRIPPSLTGAGRKLRRDWIETVISRGSHGGAGVRPYMTTQMPAFPVEVARDLAAAFEAADLGPDAGADVAPEFSEAAMEVGRELVGTAGFACITCHDVAGKPSLGIPMIDLSNTPSRLRHAWFREWLEHPMEMRPGTRMASFWTKGRSARTDLLAGEADAQIDAIWTYLSLGSGLPLPDGLVIDPGTYDLEPTGAPIYHACFWRGGSARGLAIGFPARKHLAFDQEHLRLDKLWYGAFVNAADTWDGRAGGLVSPAGEGVLSLPGGLAVAQLANAEAPWPKGDRREDGWRYLGHRRGPDGEPTFRYGRGDLVVEETLRPVFGPGGHFLRHFTVLGADAKGWSLRLATGVSIEPEFGGFRVRGPGLVADEPQAELRVTFPDLDSDAARVRATDDGFELLFPVTPDAAGRFELEVELQW